MNKRIIQRNKISQTVVKTTNGYYREYCKTSRIYQDGGKSFNFQVGFTSDGG